MRKTTFQKLDLAAQRIADRLLSIRDAMNLYIDIKKPYPCVKEFIMDNKEWFDYDMSGLVSMKNICKTTRQVHYLTNEVLHRLRRNKFFKNPATSNPAQMLLPLWYPRDFMRHLFYHACNAYCGNLGSHYYDKPTNNMEMKFSKPTPDRLYIKWLKWFAAHPKATRNDFINDFYKNVVTQRKAIASKKLKGLYHRKRYARDWYNPSGYFAVLLYHNYLDYDKKYRYHVTAKGKRLIAKADAA